MDMTQSNFNQEFVSKGVNNFDVGINIDEEIQPTKKQKPLDFPNFKSGVLKGRSKSTCFEVQTKNVSSRESKVTPEIKRHYISRLRAHF